MPIYIVRWNNPGPAVCLVRAPNKRGAAILMDAIHDDSSYCEIKEYKGFLVKSEMKRQMQMRARKPFDRISIIWKGKKEKNWNPRRRKRIF